MSAVTQPSWPQKLFLFDLDILSKVLQKSSLFPSQMHLRLNLSVLLLLSGLQTRRFPTSNTYMDDPFSLSGTVRDQPVYSNCSVLEHMVGGPPAGSRSPTLVLQVGLNLTQTFCLVSAAQLAGLQLVERLGDLQQHGAQQPR